MQTLADYNTFEEIYEHRILNFLALMKLANKQGLECGWSRKHNDGELYFGGGCVIAWIVAPSGLAAYYHMEDNRPLPTVLECNVGRLWNGREETLLALAEIAGM